MTNRVYTIGYTGRQPDDIRRLAEALDAAVLDIRYSPRSRVPRWCKSNLAAFLGDRYRHVRELGNSAYKTGAIDIVDYPAGRDLIARDPRPAVILMCGCEHLAGCHRSTVADLLAADGYYILGELTPALSAELLAASPLQPRLLEVP